MKLKEIENRMAEISQELELEGADIEALRTEFDSLKEDRAKILQEKQERESLLDDIAQERQGFTVNIAQLKGEEVKERGIDSEEYRSAFLKNLLGVAMSEEENRAFTHLTTEANNGAALLPTETQNKIYSTIFERHPILKDINVIKSGTVLSIVKHTAIEAGDAANVNEGAANDDEKNKFESVTLSGQDISKHVKFSYRLGKMAIPAFEAYLVEEIGSRIATQWAKNVIAQIVSDTAAANKFFVADQVAYKLALADILKGFSKLKGTGNLYMYANNATFYGQIAVMADSDKKISFINNYQDGIAGQVLGTPLKLEDALGDNKLLIIDPSQFTENVVQDLLIERDRDIEKHVHVMSGLMITGGVLTNPLAAAIITSTVSA